MADIIDKAIAEEKKKYMREIRKTVKKATSKTLEQIRKDFMETYDKCIDDFYRYKTTSYYRHETGVGTGTGINLYRGLYEDISYSQGYIKDMVLGWGNDDGEMRGYKLAKKQFVDPDYVLDQVMNGIRFNGDGSDYYKEMTWELSGTIETQYFGVLYGKTPVQIFDQMMSKMYMVQRRLVNKNFKMLF